MVKDYYRILKIYPSASQGLIVEAYKALMTELANGAKSGISAEDVSRLTADAREAFETLNQPDRRTAYDRQLLETMMSGGQSGGAPAGGGFGPRDGPAAPKTERPVYRTYDALKRDTELRGKTVADFLKLRPKFTEGRTPPRETEPPRRPHFTDHMLADKSTAPEPVAPESPDQAEEITSVEQGLSMAASFAIDAKAERSLEVLLKVEAGFPGDALYPKVLWRLGDLYFKSLGAPERALAYFRRLINDYPGSIESLMAEKRVDAIESLNPRPAMDLAKAKVVDDMGELWIAECPHCQNRVRVPARPGVWFICQQCNERSLVEGPGGEP